MPGDLLFHLWRGRGAVIFVRGGSRTPGFRRVHNSSVGIGV